MLELPCRSPSTPSEGGSRARISSPLARQRSHHRSVRCRVRGLDREERRGREWSEGRVEAGRVKDSGTSFSAPVVAGALALHVENCTGGDPPPHVLKARLRTGAHGRLVAWEEESGLIQNGPWDPVCPVPPSNSFYPTVADRCDYRLPQDRFRSVLS